MSNGDEFYQKLNEKQKANMKRFLKPLKWIGMILIPLIVIGMLTFNWLTDYIWMQSTGYENVYTTVLMSKLILGAIGFVLYFLITYFTLFWIHRSYVYFLDRSTLPTLILNKKYARIIIFVVAIFFGLIGTSMVQGIGWEPALKLLNYESFGQTDPHFNLDISFYLYVLPFLQFIVSLLLGLSIFMTIIVATAYSVFNMYRESRLAQLHLGISIAFIGLFLAASHLLDPYETLLTDQVNVFQSSVVYGLSYTDEVVNIPKAYVLAAIAIIGIVMLITALIKGNLIWMAIPIALYITVALAGQLVSAGVQNYIVSPNEFHQESPYLQNNLDLTLHAYDLNDITVEQSPGNQSLDEDMIERNQLTIDNVRINDSRPILDVYNQLQTFRTYYQFNDIDIDRYEIDGEYQQVFLGARELNTSDLPEQARTWVNERLRYTHGYGVTMSHVNELTPQGQPEYILEDLPPEGDLEISRPQIYFGEEQSLNVIVNTEVDEFDYPTGDENMSTRFSADTGVPLAGINRLLFAIEEQSLRMFFSDQITDESQLLATRNIKERVHRIAPFFEYDEDPYIVVRDDGTMTWILDAYLTAENYPYSEPYGEGNNYIRNSVKVAVDAYTGEVDFYMVEEEDPLLQTYANIFPELFTSDIPEDIESHFRYPEELFTIQAEKYGTYHMSNLEVFYNREDRWEFATERYFENDIVMEPYYITMQLPDEEAEEFVLMTPYTPRNRQNMIAWIGARNDGENYGELMVYEFPKQRNIYGPQQIENRINQDSRISQELNLWSQGGSRVIRGNLLTIPIEDTVMYVEPIYIESSNQTSLPEAKQVIVAYGDYIVMEATFDEALDEILSLIEMGAPANMPDVEEDIEVGDEPGMDEDVEEDLGEGTEEDGEADPSDEPADDPSGDEPGMPSEDAENRLQEIAELFDTYQEAMTQGEYERAGRIMEEIEDRLDSQ
ncbi:UPF0182 family protein [Halalkalibacillus halophilus]|uniref:UPF0182 family membrane protein n=1 Tax=Halalkalibacillus halophilus TaxID=392827 RepID=UPI0004025D7B|nr:UPF0182 family protein [Halalkalibacillus halophilus]